MKARYAVWAGRAAPAALLVVMGWQRRWTAEDAFIDFRIVRNLLAGHGPVFNPGQRVEAYTSPLWVLILAMGHAVLRIPVEWLAVLLGLGLSGTGVALGGRAATELGGDPRAFPLGMAAFVAVAAAWDFATSGLEGGLVLAWIGLSFFLLVRLRLDPGRRSAIVALVLGLGPLVRPDLLVFSAGFLLGLAVLTPRSEWLRLAGAAAAMPVAYQVFRMGYFGALEPNTALAKEATAAYWHQGLAYLGDFQRTYVLWIPVAAALVIVGGRVLTRQRDGDQAGAVLIALPVLCGVLHGLYIVRVGGDFMHGRMLLPSLFAVLLPVKVGWRPRDPRPAMAVASLVLVGWGLWALAGLRTTTGLDLKTGIADERRIWLSYAHSPHPVTVADYGRSRFAVDARELRDIARTQRVVLVGPEGDSLALPPVPLAPAIPARAVVARPSVGIIGYTTGSQVRIFDQLGLADPFGSRIRLRVRGRPGHEKLIGDEWMIAINGDPAAVMPLGAPSAALVSDARAALACPALQQLTKAVSAPLDFGRFASNFWHAWSLTRLRFDASPAVARTELCHGGGVAGAAGRR